MEKENIFEIQIPHFTAKKWYSIKISTNDIYYVFTQLMSVYSLFPLLNANTITVTKVLFNI